MKYVDKGIVYIPIKHDTTQEEINQLKEQHKNKTIVFLRSGKDDMQKNLFNFIVLRWHDMI